MAVAKTPLGSDKVVQRTVSSNYYMELIIFIEAKYTNNIHTWQKIFAAATFEGL